MLLGAIAPITTRTLLRYVEPLIFLRGLQLAQLCRQAATMAE
jgi:hypothetical protein